MVHARNWSDVVPSSAGCSRRGRCRDNCHSQRPTHGRAAVRVQHAARRSTETSRGEERRRDLRERPCQRRRAGDPARRRECGGRGCRDGVCHRRRGTADVGAGQQRRRRRVDEAGRKAGVPRFLRGTTGRLVEGPHRTRRPPARDAPASPAGQAAPQADRAEAQPPAPGAGGLARAADVRATFAWSGFPAVWRGCSRFTRSSGSCRASESRPGHPVGRGGVPGGPGSRRVHRQRRRQDEAVSQGPMRSTFRKASLSAPAPR